MKGNQILVTDNPRGRQIEGIIAGTPKPGTVMQIVRGTAADGSGRHTWEPYGTTAASGNEGVAADGDKRVIAVLLEDLEQGKTYNDAYVTGTRCFLYFPAMGEELNMLVENQTGTGSNDDYGVGDLLQVDDGTGKLIQTDSNAESEPFQILEAAADVAADAHYWVMYTGH